MILIRNLSALILFFGIIMMTFYISRSYNFNLERKEEKISVNDAYLNEISKRPTKIFKNMFDQPTVWMGYMQTMIQKILNMIKITIPQ